MPDETKTDEAEVEEPEVAYEKELLARIDDDGHITPSQDDEQRSLDIDAQVAANRVLNHRVGGNDVQPGEYGPADEVRLEAALYEAAHGPAAPRFSPESDEEATARSEAIDAQVGAASAAGAVPMVDGVATAAPTSEGPVPHADTQPAAVAGAKLDEAGGDYEALTVSELRAVAKERGVALGGATTKDDIVAALEAADEDDK